MAGRTGMVVEHLSPPGDFIDGDMTAREVLQVLTDLDFGRRGGFKTVELDRDARDFLLRVLREWARGHGGLI